MKSILEPPVDPSSYQTGLSMWPRVAIPTSLWGLVLNRLEPEFQATGQVLSIGRSMLMKGIVPNYKEWNSSHPNTVSWMNFNFFSLFALRKEKQTNVFPQGANMPKYLTSFLPFHPEILVSNDLNHQRSTKRLFSTNLLSNAEEEEDKTERQVWTDSLRPELLKGQRGRFPQHKRERNTFALFPLFCSEIWETLWTSSLGIPKNKLFLAPHTHFSLWKSDYTLPPFWEEYQSTLLRKHSKKPPFLRAHW